MPKRYRFLLYVPILYLLSREAMATEFYRCLAEAGAPPVFFQEGACRLLPDPTTPFLSISSSASSPASSSVTPSVISLRSTVPVAIPDPAVRVVGPWRVTQLLVPSGESEGPKRQGHAVINGQQVGVGGVVDGWRVRKITWNAVVMVHRRGETWVPFDRETPANFAPDP